MHIVFDFFKIFFLIFCSVIILLLGLNRKLEKLKCIKTEIIDGKAIDIPGSEFEVKSDSVIFAIGQKPNRVLLEKEGIEFNDNGFVVNNVL